MDFLCGHERKFSDSEDPDMTDVLGSDIFSTSGMVSGLNACFAMTKPRQSKSFPYVGLSVIFLLTMISLLMYTLASADKLLTLLLKKGLM